MVTAMNRRALCAAALLLVVAYPALGGSAQSKNSKNRKTAPEVFRATAKVSTDTAGGDAHLSIEVDRYTPEGDVQTMQKALQSGGSAAFVEALRKAPAAGRLKVNDRTFTIRFARERPVPNGRVISLVIDSPVYFVGGGVPDAKPRAGYDVAVVKLEMDSSGVGRGTIAAAARVKPGGESGVEVEDYASEPVKLVSVFRNVS
jgi:hypothetical protein